MHQCRPPKNVSLSRNTCSAICRSPANGRLIPGSSGGVMEWVKAEDLERVESYYEPEPGVQGDPAEDAFDIF